jgi:hypothetical protein
MARTRYKPEEIVAGGRNPPNRGERGDVLSVAPGVWRADELAALHSITSLARSSREVDRRCKLAAFCRGIEPTRLSCAV